MKEATMSRPRFHLAFPVHNLDAARAFYGGVLGCPEGRSAPDWVDFDFHGHQIVAHLAPDEGGATRHDVDGDAVPVRHFGLILEWDAWEALAARLEAAGTEFLIVPHVRFKGLPGEQGTFFVADGCGNALEFKCFRSETQIFAR